MSVQSSFTDDKRAIVYIGIFSETTQYRIKLLITPRRTHFRKDGT